jgi:hypothetical protein
MPKTKIIRDSVLGYIELGPDELKVVDTEQFQRLRRIRQLTACFLYPNANHTRFEHSLGVFRLGLNAWQALREGGWLEKQGIDGDSPELRNTLKYACLLHDVGHAPLSHLGEEFFDRDELKKELLRLLREHGVDPLGPEQMDDAKKHELMSCVFALRYFSEFLQTKEVNIGLFCRMITGQLDGITDNTGPLVEILNSPHDVDRLDYVLRDSQTTALMGVSVDYPRILAGHALNKGVLVFTKRALSSVVNLIHGRDHLYFHLYNHHTSVYTDYLIHAILQRAFSSGLARQEDYFSVRAIVDRLKDDVDLWALIKKCRDHDPCRGFACRLLERRFHKTLWKTPQEFEQAIPDDSTRNAILGTRIALERGDDPLASHIRGKLSGLDSDNVFVATRSVSSFSPKANRNVYFFFENLGDKNVQFTSLFHASIEKELPETVPYVFYDGGKTTRDDVLKVVNSFRA